MALKVWLCELQLLPAQKLYFLVVYNESVHPDELLFTLEDKTIPLIVGSTDNVKAIAERVLAKRLDDVE